ncbi:TRAP transporter small permease [Algihabitans sp.]|uniref:TRAP transporter small permease n=1 Tax=Algihabitans sp. TaxID=2821514 RepID=UPI003BAC09DE
MIRALFAINRAIAGLNWVVGWLLAALLLVMTVFIAWQVFARYVMGSPLFFSEEIARFSMVWMTMLGIGYAFRHGSLISVDILAEFGGITLRRLLAVTIPLIAVVFALVLLVWGIDITERVARQTAPSTRISMGWLYAAVPAGAALIFVNALGLLIDSVIPKRA